MLFGQHDGYARFAYNWALGEFRAGLKVGECLSERTLCLRWNKVKGMTAPWGTELSQNPAKYAIIDFGLAVNSWGACCKDVKAGQRPGRRVGFPRNKRRKHEQGFRADNGPGTVCVDGKAVILPKIGRVVMLEQLRFRLIATKIAGQNAGQTYNIWRHCTQADLGFRNEKVGSQYPTRPKSASSTILSLGTTSLPCAYFRYELVRKTVRQGRFFLFCWTSVQGEAGADRLRHHWARQ